MKHLLFGLHSRKLERDAVELKGMASRALIDGIRADLKRKKAMAYHLRSMKGSACVSGMGVS